MNALAIVLGSSIGILLHQRVPKALGNNLLISLGVLLTLLSTWWLIEAALSLPEDINVLEVWGVVLVALSIGSGIGYGLRVDDRLKAWMMTIETQRKWPRAGMAFLNASLLFVIGTLAILGPLTEAFTGNMDLLLLKSLLDGIAAMLLATTLGYGVLFSFVSVLLYQGFFYVMGLWLIVNVDTGWLPSFTLVGHVILIALGLGLMQIKTSKPVNMILSLLVVVVIYFLF